jgi:hypothetical protein
MSKVVTNKLVKASNYEYSKTIIALLYNIDLSHLKNKAFEYKKYLEFQFLTCKSTQIWTENMKFEASDFTLKLCSLLV